VASHYHWQSFGLGFEENRKIRKLLPVDTVAKNKALHNYSYLIPTSLQVHCILLMEIKVIHIPMLKNEMGNICQAFHHNRIMSLLFWKWLTKYV
jgi:hypothetical protein